MSLSNTELEIIKTLAASLGPAPPDDPAAAAKVKDMIDKYERRYAEETRSTVKRSGLNMTLPKEIVGDNVVTVFGHVPGVKPGAKFKDRGQLFVAGVHATLMKGIHAPAAKLADFAKGAYSVVMSGGYVDDEDMGEMFWYTGEGGIDAASKRQVKDQSMDRGSNAALRNNCDSRTPVRVIRGYVSAAGEGEREGGAAAADGATAGGAGARRSSGAGGAAGGGGKKEKGFVYEGLYVVLQYKMEPSKDGPLVCKFLMHGLPGHSVVNAKVEFGIFGGVPATGRLHARRLAGAGDALPLGKRARLSKDRRALEAARKVMLSDIRRRYPEAVLLSEDISGGQEPVPIPLINEVNDEKLPPDFTYIREYTWAKGVYELVVPVLNFVDEEMAEFTRVTSNGTCGLAFNRMIAEKDLALGDKLPAGYEPHMEQQYNSAGCLLVTDPCGVHECGSGCTSARCRLNKQLTNGVALPLEVFMTAHKGWGVRCRDAIPAGAFVCCYVGQLVTDHMAEVRKGVDHYLFNLDFFAHIYLEIAEKGLEEIAAEIPLHKIPPVPPISAVRKAQVRAATEARALKAQAAAEPAGRETADGGAAVAAAAPARGGGDAAGAGPSRQPADGDAAGGDGAAGASTVPSVSVRAAAASTTGVLGPELVQSAARDLLASCCAVAAGGQGGGGGGGSGAGPGSGPRRPDAKAAAAAAAAAPGPSTKPGLAAAAAVVEAAVAAAAAEDDPGVFYLQQIFGRDDQAAAAAAGGEATGGGGGGTSSADVTEDDEFAPILVLDARSMGNVGRFINHSCEGNLAIQAVFAEPYRNTLLYHVGLYASQDIPAMTELTYNYGYHSQAGRGGAQYGMECHCGAANCVGQLM